MIVLVNITSLILYMRKLEAKGWVALLPSVMQWKPPEAGQVAD